MSEDNKNETLYAAYRSGIRVSDAVYNSRADHLLEREISYWENILYRYPDGTKMEILPVRYRDRK